MSSGRLRASVSAWGPEPNVPHAHGRNALEGDSGRLLIAEQGTHLRNVLGNRLHS